MGARPKVLLGLFVAASIARPGFALPDADPFSEIAVTAGASSSAAARTLDQIKSMIAEQVRNGQMSADAGVRLYQKYSAALMPHAASAKKLPTIAETVRLQQQNAPPKSQEQTKPSAPNPTAVKSLTPSTAATTTKPLKSAVGDSSDAFFLSDRGTSAFRQLDGLLSRKRGTPEKEGTSAGSASDSAAGSESTADISNVGFSFPGFSRPGSTVEGRMGAGVMEQAPEAPDKTKPVVPAKPASQRTGGIRRGIASTPYNPIFAAPIRGSAEDSLLAAPRLSLVDRIKAFMWFDNVELPQHRALPRWIHWIFAAALMLLLARAARQAHRRRSLR